MEFGHDSNTYHHHEQIEYDLLQYGCGRQIDRGEASDSHCGIAEKERVKVADMEPAIAAIKYARKNEWDEGESKEMDSEKGAFVQYKVYKSSSMKSVPISEIPMLRLLRHWRNDWRVQPQSAILKQ